MQNAQWVLLVRYGEVFLKGLNRGYFLSTLRRHIRRAVEPIGGTVDGEEGRFYVRNTTDMDETVRRVSRVFGVHSVSPALEVEKQFETICTAARELMHDRKGTFKVQSRRADKNFPLDSMQMNIELGGEILSDNPGLKVDVHNPDLVLEVEVREKAYLHLDTIPAVGGMPIGTNGKALTLLSGGIDSPVASYMIAKRGVTLEAIHYHSAPFTSEQAKQKVIDLAKVLSEYCGPIRLHVIPFTRLQQELYTKCPDAQLTVLMRRYMMRIAEAVARKNECSALVTGESIGQVASQTMESLACTDAVVDMPVFRPLIGFDKSEIIERATKIGTYDLSILPYEDCCTIFTPRHPVTHPRIESIEKSEPLIDGDGLVQEALDNEEIILVHP